MKHRHDLALKLHGKAPSRLEAVLDLHLKAAGIPAPEREYKFHSSRKWRFDFAFPDQKVGIECEGGSWINGAHSRGARFEKDAQKYNTAILGGWRVLRFTGRMIDSGEALETIEAALNQGGEACASK
jgi:very-short-patch-repair endonuclease